MQRLAGERKEGAFEESQRFTMAIGEHLKVRLGKSAEPPPQAVDICLEDGGEVITCIFRRMVDCSENGLEESKTASSTAQTRLDPPVKFISNLELLNSSPHVTYS